MENLHITPEKLKGEVTAPPSKSVAHRLIIASGMAKGISNIQFPKEHPLKTSLSKDISATIEGMTALGATYTFLDDNSIEVNGENFLQNLNNENTPLNTIDCIESGSTLRFLIPLGGLTSEKVTFDGAEGLRNRPLTSYYDLFDHHHITYETTQGKLPLTLTGQLQPGAYSLPGNISSQFISGLLFALPLLHGDSTIEITTEVESIGYIDLTLNCLASFGIQVTHENYKKYTISGNQQYVPKNKVCEGDYSQAAFYMVGGLLGESITINGLDPNSAQGDKAIIPILKAMGGHIEFNQEGQLICSPSLTKGIDIDVSQCPDLVPILTVIGSLSQGTTRILNAARLKIKESDRLRSISTEINKIGGNVQVLEDGLIINGVSTFTGGLVNSWNDHRISMSLGMASIRCKEPIILENYKSVEKSYPNFWENFNSLRRS